MLHVATSSAVIDRRYSSQLPCYHLSYRIMYAFSRGSMRMSKVRPDYDSHKVPEERRRLVEQSRQKWISQLIDFSRRNNLLYFRQLKNGTVDVTNAPPEF